MTFLFHCYREFNNQNTSKERRFVFNLEGGGKSGETPQSMNLKGLMQNVDATRPDREMLIAERDRRKPRHGGTTDLPPEAQPPRPPAAPPPAPTPAQKHGESATGSAAEVKDDQEVMEDPEILLMEESVISLLQHYTNISFRLFIENTKTDPRIMDVMEKAIKYADELSYKKEGNKVVITKRPGSKEKGVPDDLKIVTEQKRVAEITGSGASLTINPGSHTAWPETFKYATEAIGKMKKYNKREGPEPSPEETQYCDFLLTRLPAVVLQAVQLRGALPGEESLLRSEIYKTFEQKAKDPVMIAKLTEVEGKGILIMMWRKKIDEGVPLITFDPASFVVRWDTEKEEFQKLPLYDHAFANRYREKHKGEKIERKEAPALDTPAPAPKPRATDEDTPPATPKPPEPKKPETGNEKERLTQQEIIDKVMANWDRLIEDPRKAEQLVFKQLPKAKKDKMRPHLEGFKKDLDKIRDKTWFPKIMGELKTDLKNGDLRPGELLKNPDKIMDILGKYSKDFTWGEWISVGASAATFSSMAEHGKAIEKINAE